MSSKILTIQFECLDNKDLNEHDAHMVKMAQDATQLSYAPYSQFSVGASIELDNGEIITGSNQENASYTTGTCAERCAVFYANSQYPNVGIKSIAIAARTQEGTYTESPITPCGACRQVLAEVEQRYHPIRILLYGKEQTWIFNRIKDLLPFQFNSSAF